MEPDHEAGFMTCWWSDGFAWLSEMPILQYMPRKVLKKPASSGEEKKKTTKPPTTIMSAQVRKRIYSQAYHHALLEAKRKGKTTDEATKLARAAGQSAVSV